MAINSIKIEEEINVFELLSYLWKMKFLIIGITAIFTAAGVGYATYTKPLYESHTTVAPKESDKNNSAAMVISQFGGVGSAVANQFGLGSTNLKKIQVILKSRDFSKHIIKKHDLLPILFNENWDSVSNSIVRKGPLVTPDIELGGEYFQKNVLFVNLDVKGNLLELQVRARTPELSQNWLRMLLKELDIRLKSELKKEFVNNERYLSNLLKTTSDPILLEKIQNLIAYELEKKMLINASSFEILEEPTYPLKKFKPNKKLIMILSLILGVFFSIFLLLSIKVILVVRKHL